MVDLLTKLKKQYPKHDFIKLYLLADSNFKKQNYEISMLLSCIIIEAIANQKYCGKANKNMGFKEKFSKIVVDAYAQNESYPYFIEKRTTIQIINGKKITNTSIFPMNTKTDAQINEIITKKMNFIYKEYRCNFCHFGQNLPKNMIFRTKHFFGISGGDVITGQDILGVTLYTLNYYFEQIYKS
jgi:hypothetical protein